MTRRQAILLDALGTLLAMEPPAPALRAQLRARFDVDIGLSEVERAVAAEIAHYRAHHLEGRDRQSLADLRGRCARVLGDGLGLTGDVPAAELESALLAALRFSAYPDVADALSRLAHGGARLVVVSNWDCSLGGVLERTGLRHLLDGVVTSAEAGAAKPASAIFARALETAGVRAADALHVGDSLREDVEGARAAGIEAVMIVRAGGLPAPGTAPIPGLRTISSLTELATPAT